jgi:hypothetical protein
MKAHWKQLASEHNPGSHDGLRYQYFTRLAKDGTAFRILAAPNLSNTITLRVMGEFGGRGAAGETPRVGSSGTLAPPEAADPWRGGPGPDFPHCHGPSDGPDEARACSDEDQGLSTFLEYGGGRWRIKCIHVNHTVAAQMCRSDVSLGCVAQMCRQDVPLRFLAPMWRSDVSLRCVAHMRRSDVSLRCVAQICCSTVSLKCVASCVVQMCRPSV